MFAFLKLVPWWAWPAAALIAAVVILDLRVHHLASEVTAYKAAAATYAKAQQTNLATIDALSKANAQWADTYRARIALAQSYIQANIEYQNQLQGQLAATRKQLGVIYASHPEAKHWAAQPVPAAIADQLRDASRR